MFSDTLLFIVYIKFGGLIQKFIAMTVLGDKVLHLRQACMTYCSLGKSV